MNPQRPQVGLNPRIRGKSIHLTIQILSAASVQYYNQNVNRCKVHTVPDPLLRSLGSITYPGHSVHASRSHFDRIFPVKRRGSLYDQAVGLNSISEFGKATTKYGNRDQFRCFARDILFDKTAYALSSRLMYCLIFCYDALGQPLTLENRNTRPKAGLS